MEYMQFLYKVFVILLGGSVKTLELFGIVIVASIPLGFLITLLATSRVKILRAFAKLYIFVLRGTPLLLQILVIYLVLPKIPKIGQYLIFDGFTAASIAFILNYAAYFAEIFRGGLISIDKGQYEACQVLGMNHWQTTVRVIIPQMLRVSLPSVGNEIITLMKDTSLLCAVSVPELLFCARKQVLNSLDIAPYIIAGLLYLAMTFVLSYFFKWIERELSRNKPAKNKSKQNAELAKLREYAKGIKQKLLDSKNGKEKKEWR